MPSSIAATRCDARRRSSVIGSPIALLRLPCVASTPASPKCARRMAASISFTVVLPLLPTMTITGIVNCRRQCAAERAERGLRVVGDDEVAGESSARSAATSAATAPRSKAVATKSWPSKRSPESATKRSPSCSVRVSVVTRAKRHRIADDAPGDGARGGGRVHHASAPARERARARPRRRRSACARRRLPGSPRGPCRRSARRRPASRRKSRRRSRCARSRSTVQRRFAVSRTPRTMPLAMADGILATRVVGGHDDAVGELARDVSHLRALAGIAVAAAAEHADEIGALAARPAAATSAPFRAHRACGRSRRSRAAARRRPAAASVPAAP